MSWNKISEKVTQLSGNSLTFGVACCIIITWLVSGPFLGFSDTWQLIINTFTTLVTFLMVFLIQNSQNREQKRFATWLQSDLKNTKQVLAILRRIDKRTGTL